MKDNDNEDGLQFSDMIEALGLTQWVNSPTYTEDNILDLVLTEAVCD